MEAVDDIEDFKPNSTLSAGINVFLSGCCWKKQVISIDIDNSNGKIYTVQDCENGKTLVQSKYLLRTNMIRITPDAHNIFRRGV
jgi:hypothetical protein